MAKIEGDPDYRVEMGVDGDDHIVAVMPPVDITFREQMYDELDEAGLLKEVIVRGGHFYETQHLTDGTHYSELRISSTALKVAGQSLARIAHLTGEVLRRQPDTTADVSPYIVTVGGSRRFFEDTAVREERHG
jgi:hypothetical protein